MTGKMISVIIIVKNEQDKIGNCLESVRWADEIVVVDSGSDDDTLEICRQYTDQITVSEWSGFGPQKNKALALATQPWILSIDADERVSDELREEIIAAIARDSDIGAYLLPRSSSFCGRMMQYSGWHPDFILRLFKKDQAKFSDDSVHEKVITSANTDRLKNPLLHYSFDNYQQVVEKMNLYSTLAAEDKFKHGEKSTLFKAVSRGFWTFLRTYIFKLGFLDGKQGFTLSVSNAEGTYYKYVKLAYLHSRSENS